MYQTILSHISIAFVVFFFMNALFSNFASVKLKDPNANWHAYMSIFIGIYTFFLGINTHITSEQISNTILHGHWITSYLALFCYLNAIEFYLDKKIEILKYPKMVFLSISFIYVVQVIIFQFTGKSIFLDPITPEMVTYYSKYSYITAMGSTLGVSIGYFGIAWIVFSSIVIWRELNKSNRKEYVLQTGIVICLATGAYDTAIGLGHLKQHLPFFYLGFALESLRFVYYNKNLAIQTFHGLNEKVGQLSKVAQFGIVTGSISHDIRNHLFLIQGNLRMLKKKYDEKYIDSAVKHTNEINEITKLYTDLFRKNLEKELNDVSIKDILNHVNELTAKKIEISNTKLKLFTENDFIIPANATEIALCVVNLINNSIDAINNDEEKWIEIRTCDKERCIHVIDSGRGIPQDQVDKIFEMDYSTKKGEGGTGLGLAIVKQILNKHGFTLSYLPNQRNTTFQMKF